VHGVKTSQKGKCTVVQRSFNAFECLLNHFSHHLVIISSLKGTGY